MLRDLIILNYENALKYNPKRFEKVAMIRISSKSFDPLKYKSKFIDILELNFLDIEEEDFYKFSEEEILSLKTFCPNPYPISLYQAEKIINFLNKHLNNIDTLIVHCDKGLSRSPSIAFFIAKYFIKNDDLAQSIKNKFSLNKTVLK